MDDLRQRLSRILDPGNARSSSKTSPTGEEKQRAEKVSSIRRQLERLEGRWVRGSANLDGGTGGIRPLDDVLKGSLTETDYGPCLEMQASYRISFRHGSVCLRDFGRVDLTHLDVFCGGSGEEEIDPEDVLFVDLETTGLSHGTGTYAFLVGFGFFKEGRYHIRQLFLRDFQEEEAFLHRALEIMTPFRFLAHFNGKSFDMPLLDTRFTMCRLEARTNHWRNWDLLYPSRRLWKDRLEDCRLETLEAHKLSVKREARDIRGDRIPELYYRYLHTGDARDLDRVVYHNAVDVLSLATLAIHIDKNLRAKDPADMDLVRTGRYYEKKGLSHKGLACFRIASDTGRSDEEKNAALFLMARQMKKTGDLEEAVQIWEELIRQGSSRAVDCCEELAKYHEHKTRDLALAIQAVEQAQEIVDADDVTRGQALEKRLARLKRRERGKSWDT